jgi:hypothetical protein
MKRLLSFFRGVSFEQAQRNLLIAFIVDFILIGTSWMKSWLPEMILGVLVLLASCYMLKWMVAVVLGMIAHSRQFTAGSFFLNLLGLFVCVVFLFISFAFITAVYHLQLR